MPQAAPKSVGRSWLDRQFEIDDAIHRIRPPARFGSAQILVRSGSRCNKAALIGSSTNLMELINEPDGRV
jgi:hypothetical protein